MKKLVNHATQLIERYKGCSFNVCEDGISPGHWCIRAYRERDGEQRFFEIVAACIPDKSAANYIADNLYLLCMEIPDRSSHLTYGDKGE